MNSRNLRNVVLLGHSGSGKTSFAETMLFEAKAIQRMGTVSDANTISDYTNIEKEKGNSIFSSLMHVHWKNSKINILDTPGSDDFVGEVISSMKVADTGLILINAANGVEVGTELIWEYIQDFQTPGIFVVNQVDHDKSDYDKTLEQMQERFGSKVLPIQYPMTEGSSYNAIIDALRMIMYVFDESGGKPRKEAIPESEIARAQEMHNVLVEVAAENDEGLMERFFDEGSLTEEELAEGLTIALATQSIYPVFCCSATKNMGSGRIMGFINDIAPSPVDRPAPLAFDGHDIKCDADADTSVFIYKTLSEPRVGMVSYFKVFSGKLDAGAELYNSEHQHLERINQLFVAEGINRSQVSHLIAGDIGVTVKLKNSHTNETLMTKGSNMKIEPIHFPAPRIRVAIKPSSKNEMEKLMKALYGISEEDPTLIVEQSPSLGQTLLHGQGQLHLDIIKYRIDKVNDIKMDFEKPKIPYRETITKVANVSYRHKKQSGGSGQFGEVHMRVEPVTEYMKDTSDLNVRSVEEVELPWGGKMLFQWCIVGGSIDNKYQNAIKKGIMEKMENGPLTGSCCQNIRVSIYDGKMHPVDSNDMAFMLAAGKAFDDAFNQCDPKLLEPIYNLEILCSDQVMGDVMSDLQGRRAMIQGMESEGHYQKIIAKVPLSELYKYSATLRSISQGKAKFNRSFSHYDLMLPEIQAKVVNESKSIVEAA